MIWEELLAQRRVAREPTDREEIERLRALAQRNLKDAAIEELSEDGRFERAYAAARALATIVIRVCGYRVRQPGAHYGTFLALEAADPETFAVFATYFDSCRGLRNTLSYDAVDVVSHSDLEDILGEVLRFETIVSGWLVAKRQTP